MRSKQKSVLKVGLTVLALSAGLGMYTTAAAQAGRVTFLMGHSMGGAGTYFLGSKYAREWAALAPIAPAAFLINENRADVLQTIRDAGIPVFVVQGDEDPLVPVDNTRMWVETMEEIGLHHEYVEVAGGDHGNVISIGMPDIFAFFEAHPKADR